MDADARDLKAVIGGDDWPPLFAQFYLRAAQMLLDKTEAEGFPDVALPILYLQRHCLELVIKDLTLGCFHLQEARSLASPSLLRITPPKWEHDLPYLVNTLAKNLNQLQVSAESELSSLSLLATEFAKIENGSHERLRYAYVEPFKAGLAPPTSFPTKLDIPVGALQKRLEAVFKICADINIRDSFLRKLYDAAGIQVVEAIKAGRISLEDDGT